MKYEGPKSYQSKDMTKVKVFVDKQTDKWTGQKLYAPNLLMRGHKNAHYSTFYSRELNPCPKDQFLDMTKFADD